MGELNDFIVCTIKRNLAKMTFKFYQLDIINKITQGFEKDVESLMTFNNPATPYKGIVHNK